MRRGKGLVVLLLILLVIAAVSAAATLRRQEQPPARAAKEQPPAAAAKEQEYDVNKIFEDYPLLDLGAPEPADLTDRTIRQARNRRYDNTDLSPAEAELFKIQGRSTTSVSGPNYHAPPETALPVTESEAIVIGEVTSARAFLSNDQVNVYSEYGVTVKEVLKNNSPAHLYDGVSIAVERFGARVRLPSGKVIAIGFTHQSMPRPGRRYLLFLKYAGEAQIFPIITGYELRAGKVSPLDGNRRYQGKYKYDEVAEYDRYEGAEESELLKEVRAIIAQHSSKRTRGVN